VRKARAAASTKGKKLPLGASSSDNAPAASTDAEQEGSADAAPKKGKTTRRKAAPASSPVEEQDAPGEALAEVKPKTRKARAPTASIEPSSDAAPSTAAATKGKARAKRAVASAADEENVAPEAVEAELDVRTTRRGTRRR
jgi:hypothetical protein